MNKVLILNICGPIHCSNLFLCIVVFVPCLGNLQVLQDNEIILLYFYLEVLLFYFYICDPSPCHFFHKSNNYVCVVLLQMVICLCANITSHN